MQYMSYTTSILPMTMASPSRSMPWLWCILISIILLWLISRLIWMLSLLRPWLLPLSPPIAMPVGVLKLAMQWWRAPFCRSSNFKVWMVVLSSTMVAKLDGLESARNILLSALVKQRFVPQAPLPNRLLISEISVKASLIQDFLFLMLPHQCPLQ